MEEKETYRIILIDDERVAMRSYWQDLQLDGYQVTQYVSTQEVEAFISSNKPEEVDFFIIDIMIDLDPLYSSEKTDYGRLTGLFLALDIRKRYPEIPIILLSNTSFDSVLAATKRLTSRLKDCIYLRKQDILPHELTEIVTNYFKKMKLSPNHKLRAFRKLFRSLMLEPNFYGIGIDLKKLGKDE